MAAVAFLVPALVACGTGFQAQTNQIYQPGPGVSVRNGGVYAINALIVSDATGNGTLVGALINQQVRPDVLTSVGLTTTAGKALHPTILSGTVALPPQKAVQLADTSDVRVAGGLDPGAFYELTLTFRNAAPVKVEIPALPETSTFSGVTVGPVPTPTTPSHSNPS